MTAAKLIIAALMVPMLILIGISAIAGIAVLVLR
jgi:hypothetical protein